VSAELEHPKSIRSAVLLEDEMVCIMRGDHPAARRPLTVKAYRELKHIKIAQTAADMRLVDGYLSRHSLPDTRLSIPHWLAAPSVVESSDFVASVSRRMADIVNASGRFAVRPLPTGRHPFQWRLYWHTRYDSDGPHAWMRKLIRRACRGSEGEGTTR
jgi:DNA-binding transcriptional LysR family regulator